MGQDQVQVNDQGHRFTVAVGESEAGFTVYHDSDGVRTFPHTEIREDFQGRGLATALVVQALETTRTAGLQVLPLCPLVRGVVAKRGYVDLVPADRRAELGLG